MEDYIFDFDTALKFFSPTLYHAFKEDSPELILKLLDDYKQDEIKYLTGSTPLHLAAFYKRSDLIERFIKDGYDVNTRDTNGATPLLYAVLNNHVHITNVLCDAGAKVWLADDAGRSPLTILSSEIQFFNWTIIRIIMDSLKNNAVNVEFIKSTLIDANCPIRVAVHLCNVEVTKALIESGQDVNSAERYNGYTSLHIATTCCYVEQVRLLLEHGADVNIKSVYGQKPIFFIRGECLDIAKMLLDAGTDVYESAEDGNMQLHEPLARGHRRIVRLILDYLTRLNQRDKNGNTAIHFAARNKREGVAELFLSKEFDTTVEDKFGQTALHVAAYSTNIKFMKLLLTKGADVNHRNAQGCTPLFKAIRNNIYSEQLKVCIELLIDHGTDFNHMNNDGRYLTEEVLRFRPEFAGIFVKHVAYLRALGKPVESRIVEVIEGNFKNKLYLQKFEKELKAMKEISIFRSVKYFNVLTDPVNKIAEYTRYRLLRLTFIQNFAQLFPFYAEKLAKKFHQAVLLMNETIKVENILGDCLQIEEEFVRKIVSFMSRDKRLLLLNSV